VVAGKVKVGDNLVEVGDYLFTTAGQTHFVEAKEVSEILVFSEKGIEIVE